MRSSARYIQRIIVKEYSVSESSDKRITVKEYSADRRQKESSESLLYTHPPIIIEDINISDIEDSAKNNSKRILRIVGL